MANIVDIIKQLGEAEAKQQEANHAVNRKAYSNMMTYLKELKLHNVKNLELAEQIYLLSENSVEKLNEMHEVLTEKLAAQEDSQDAEEILKRTRYLQRQIGELSVMLREVYEKQEAANAQPEEPVSQGITYEEFKEMLEVWKQFEVQMESMNDSSKQAFEESLEDHERGIKKEITAVQEMLELTQRDHYNTMLNEIINVKKVVKGYARTAMWASCLALIVLILDILILK